LGQKMTQFQFPNPFFGHPVFPALFFKGFPNIKLLNN
jgi:hypothetical protein